MEARLTTPLSGYSTQARVSLLVAALINNGRIHFWFATSINPTHNDLTSNPLEIFAQLQRVTRRGRLAADAEKVESLLVSLATWVYEAQRSGVSNANQAALMIRDTRGGQVDLLEPTMFELREVIPDHYIGEDEYIVENEPIAKHQRAGSYSLAGAPGE